MLGAWLPEAFPLQGVGGSGPETGAMEAEHLDALLWRLNAMKVCKARYVSICIFGDRCAGL